MSSLTRSLRRTQDCANQGTLTLTDLGENGAIVMLSERDQMLTINPSAAFVLQQLLAMEQSVDDSSAALLGQKLADRFALSTEQANSDVARFFDQFEKWL